MSTVVRLNVPPFEPTSPTSLSALHRPLVTQEQARCEAHCQPCAACEAEREKTLAEARKVSQDTALRLSQLVEDALAVQIARIEAEQADLVASVLSAVLPHLAQAALRSALSEEIATASLAMRNPTFLLAKHPDMDLGPIGEDSRIILQDDDRLPLHHVELRRDGGATQINPDPLIAACIERLTAPAMKD